MGKPNYSFQKRQKELAKQAKKEEKRLRKQNKANETADPDPAQQLDGTTEPTD